MKRELCQPQGMGCALRQVPGSLLRPVTPSLQTQQPSQHHPGIGQGVMLLGDETQEMAFSLRNRRLPRAWQPAGQPLPTQTRL